MPQDTLDFCTQNNITVTAYSPLERGDAKHEAPVVELAKKYSVTREEFLLRWLMQKGMIVIPRSSNPNHIDSNYHALAWEMETNDVMRIDELG
jgi:diketogulonate reductase-like aldo/keto reductase